MLKYFLHITIKLKCQLVKTEKMKIIFYIQKNKLKMRLVSAPQPQAEKYKAAQK